MSATDTLVTEPTTETGDSPAGGSPTPPPQVTPPDLPPPRPRERSILGRLTIGVMLVGLGVLAILDNVDSIPIEADPRHYMALAVTILGVGLVVGSFAGRARWLIIVAAVMVPTLMFSPLFEDWDTEFDLTVQPVTFSELATTYTGNVGRMEVDLRYLPWDGQSVDLVLDLDIGQIVVLLPDDVGVTGKADANIGEVEFRDPGRTVRRDAGLGQLQVDFNQPGDAGTVDIDAHVDIGNVQVRIIPGVVTGGNS